MIENASPHWLVPDGWTRAEVIAGIGVTYRLLWYEDGTLRFEHPCTAGDGSDCINAPKITKHTVDSDEPGHVTISPSILCKGCDTHGFIRESRWQAA